MTRHRFPTVIAVALAAAFIGTAAAQTQSNDTSRMPANKGMSKADQVQPSNDPSSKVQGQSQSTGQTNEDHAQSNAANHNQKNATKANAGTQASEQSNMQHQAMNTHKGTRHHAGKSKRQSEEAMAPDEKAYREALRDCAKEQNSSQRDSCLDNAIERFHKNA